MSSSLCSESFCPGAAKLACRSPQYFEPDGTGCSVALQAKYVLRWLAFRLLSPGIFRWHAFNLSSGETVITGATSSTIGAGAMATGGTTRTGITVCLTRR